MATKPGPAKARQPRGRPASLDLFRISTAGLKIMDAEGPDALTFRRLSEELGVGATTLYSYVRTKDELMEVVVDAVLAELPVPAARRWQDAITTWFGALYELFLDHPGVARQFGIRPVLGRSSHRSIDATMAALLSAGFSADEAVSLFMACASVTVGSSLFATAPVDPNTDGFVFPLISPAQSPALTKVALAMGQRRHPAHFQEALQYVIDGVTARTPGGGH